MQSIKTDEKRNENVSTAPELLHLTQFQCNSHFTEIANSLHSKLCMANKSKKYGGSFCFFWGGWGKEELESMTLRTAAIDAMTDLREERLQRNDSESNPRHAAVQSR